MRVSKELLTANDSKGFSGKHCFHRVTDTCFTNEMDSSQNRGLVIFLAGPLCIRNGPLFVMYFLEILSLRERAPALFFRRFLASDLRQDGELYLEAQHAVFFRRETWSFPKKQDV